MDQEIYQQINSQRRDQIVEIAVTAITTLRKVMLALKGVGRDHLVTDIVQGKFEGVNIPSTIDEIIKGLPVKISKQANGWVFISNLVACEDIYNSDIEAIRAYIGELYGRACRTDSSRNEDGTRTSQELDGWGE